MLKSCSTIGIIGGGQLGRMMALAAKSMGFRVVVLEPSYPSPCTGVADVEITASYNDRLALQNLAVQSDVVTFEFENVDIEGLRLIEEKGKLPQGSRILEITCHRWREKSFMKEQGLRIPKTYHVTSIDSLQRAVRNLGFPAVLKTCRGGYDGKGQWILRNEADVKAVYHVVTDAECVVEEWVSFQKEISVIVQRNERGQSITLPIGENVHKNGILHTTTVPANISNEVEQEAIRYATVLADAFNLVGTLALELFVGQDGQLYCNECAPRPHNSGHYSMDACQTSQFEQHIRAVCNWDLAPTTLLHSVVMVNVLGEHVRAVKEAAVHWPEAKIHFYGKRDAKVGRKMGHVNVLCDTIEKSLHNIETKQIWNEAVVAK